jgi:serine/threonine protein kinase
LLDSGDTIGDWVVIDVLGEGGMGAVYRCHSTLSDRLVAAVKVMKPIRMQSARERFVREVEALAALRHDSILAVRGGGQDEHRGLLFYAMELLEGEDLEHALAAGPIDYQTAADLIARFADGLAYAHDKGIAHRDIKPANFFLCSDGTVRVVDFGIAIDQSRTRLTATGMVPGTVAYMPPEVLRGEEAPDPFLGDVHALGLVLYECVVGSPAFAADPRLSDGAAIGQIVARKMDAPALDPGDVFPGWLRDAIRGATEPSPAARTPSMAELAAQLRARDTADTALPTSSPETRWVRGLAEATDGAPDTAEPIPAPPSAASPRTTPPPAPTPAVVEELPSTLSERRAAPAQKRRGGLFAVLGGVALLLLVTGGVGVVVVVVALGTMSQGLSFEDENVAAVAALEQEITLPQAGVDHGPASSYRPRLLVSGSRVDLDYRSVNGEPWYPLGLAMLAAGTMDGTGAAEVSSRVRDTGAAEIALHVDRRVPARTLVELARAVEAGGVRAVYVGLDGPSGITEVAIAVTGAPVAGASALAVGAREFGLDEPAESLLTTIGDAEGAGPVSIDIR